METINNSENSVKSAREGLIEPSSHIIDEALTNAAVDSSEKQHTVSIDSKPVLLEGMVSENINNHAEVQNVNETETNIENKINNVDSDEVKDIINIETTETSKLDISNTSSEEKKTETQEEKQSDIQPILNDNDNILTEKQEEVPSEHIVGEEIEVKRDPNLVSITFRPMDQNWVMGEDWTVDFNSLTTLISLREFIEKERGISRHRIQLRLKGKVLPLNREIWTLRRLGIYDGYTIIVEPTLSGSWLWETKEYYINKLLNDVCNIIKLTENNRINLKELNKKIKMPPCIKSTLRVFLRQYPERFYIHTDITNNELYIHNIIKPYQIPTFHHFSIDIGYYTYYKPKPYNWLANKDIDDMYKIETLPEDEVVVEEIEKNIENNEEKERIDENNMENNNNEKKELVINEEDNERLIAMIDDEENNNTITDSNNNEK